MLQIWSDRDPAHIADIIKRYFRFYGINRHKMTVLTPSIHLNTHSIDDNRFDMRPFLYYSWEHQFKTIDNILKTLK